MSEARILAAFWQPKSKRFCELTADEIMERSGHHVTCGEFRALIEHKVIRFQTIYSDARCKVYRLAPEGERRVSAMVVMNRLPKIGRRLTAVPIDSKREPHPQANPVTVRGKVFPSMSACARHFGISVQAVACAVERGTTDNIGTRKEAAE
jgi:hypothetical protein